MPETTLSVDSCAAGRSLRDEVLHKLGFEKLGLLAALVSLALFCLLCPGRASGQGAVTTGVLEGEIRDQSGAALPGAKVIVTSQDAGWSRETAADQSGYFVDAQLPVGVYEIRVQFPNFRPALVRDRRLDVGSVESLRIVLELAKAPNSC